MSAHAEQVSHYRAVRARLFKPATAVKAAPRPAPKAAPVLLVFRDFDEHVRAWRKWRLYRETLAKAVEVAPMRVSGHFEAFLTPYPYDISFVIGESPAIPDLRRSMPDICRDVLQDFPGVTLAEVKGDSRRRPIVQARFACMEAIRSQRKDLSFPAIGRFFGDRDHSCVYNALKKIKAQREKEQA